MQQPELQAIALDRADAGGIDSTPSDRVANAVEKGTPRDGMDADLSDPDLRANRRIERAATQHVLPAAVVGQHDIVHREPADRHHVHHGSPPSSARRRAVNTGCNAAI